MSFFFFIFKYEKKNVKENTPSREVNRPYERMPKHQICIVALHANDPCHRVIKQATSYSKTVRRALSLSFPLREPVNLRLNRVYLRRALKISASASTYNCTNRRKREKPKSLARIQWFFIRRWCVASLFHRDKLCPVAASVYYIRVGLGVSKLIRGDYRAPGVIPSTIPRSYTCNVVEDKSLRTPYAPPMIYIHVACTSFFLSGASGKALSAYSSHLERKRNSERAR